MRSRASRSAPNPPASHAGLESAGGRARTTSPHWRTPVVVVFTLLLSGAVHAADVAGSGDPARSAIHVYQNYLSSMRHMHCRFAPSCSQYAMEAIEKYGLVEGSSRAADRLMRCNESSETRYPRNSDGLLVDPVGGATVGATVVRVPAWLLPGPESPAPPASAALRADRRARFEEAVEFALLMERRGDCERASAELQRVGALADTLPAHAWAYARIGRCYFDASQWYFADRAYLTSAMLTTDPARRAHLGYAAAVSRFDAGAYVACAELLSDPALALDRPAGRATALKGLCALSHGDWLLADRLFRAAALETDGTPMHDRVMALAPYAERGGTLPRRSARVAGALSTLLPGAGQVYSGHPRDGVRHLLFNAALVYTVVSLASHEQVPAAVLVGSVELPFYIGNILGARDAARRFDEDHRMRLVERAVSESSH